MGEAVGWRAGGRAWRGADEARAGATALSRRYRAAGNSAQVRAATEEETSLQHPHQRHQQDLHQDRQGEENTVSALDPLIPDARICRLKHGGLP